MKRNALVPIVVLVLAAGACQTLSLDYRQGVKAEMNQNFEEAVRQYQKAALEHPNDATYRIALFRARNAACLFYLQAARTLVEQNKKKEAELSYRKALFFDPRNYRATSELRALLAPPEKAAKNGEKLEGPVRLKGSGEPLELSFRNEVSLRSIFQTLGRMTGVNFLYDDTFRDTNLAIDLTGKDLQQAISFLCVASKNFSRVIDERTVIIVPDNVQKRMQYELNAIKTFYLSNIDASDVQMRLTQMVKTMYKVPSIQVDKNLNTVTIRDTPQAVALAEKLLRMWDKSKAEVQIDIEIMEVDRVREKNFGIDVSNGTLGLQFLPDTADSDGYFPIRSSDGSWIDFGNLQNYQMTVPTALAQIISGDSDTKIIAQPKIRGLSGEKIEYIVGQKVPIVNSQFAAYAAGGVSNVPITSYTMTDIGITIKMTPKVHREGEVTLEIEMAISSLAGTGTADIPIIANREVKNTVRLKDGETNLLAGLLRDEERVSIGGVTWLKDIPLLGNLFAATKKEVQQTDVVLTITPHIIRDVELTEEDAKPLWVDPDNLSGVTGAGAAVTPPNPRQAAVEEPAEPEDTGASGVYLSPASFEAPREREFRMNVELSSEQEIGNASLVLTFDPRVLKLKDVLEGGGLRQLGENVPFLKSISGGTCTIGFSSPPGGRGFTGRGVLAVLVFTSVGPGQASLGFASASAGSPMGQAVVLETGEATVNIR
ncbi:MAG TPA: secretin N-terminal domain-containing protein [Candidatus Aminicenantes bacterium]|nr:secretin N-terminal domain-containing protein [Candidatus Aminicenantes bacterium]HRY64700.1 secretin N-terminal domain-containing protein [Candidatus Aminicenantes bacterium]HRZ71613.1 secretin N-terminal domain-containing protein [Candidatus Aminicenantes bacterium]